LFKEPTPSCVGWVDASDHAIGGVLAELNSTGTRQATVTMDNWVLDGAGVLPYIRNAVKMQVDEFPTRPRIVTDHDLDPDTVKNLYLVHRNLTYA
jgi:hypothetical protein